MNATNLKLEFLTDKFLHDPSDKQNKALMDEIVHLLIEDARIIIDGEQLEDGQIDPAHIEVELDHRFYFHVYTSRIAFDKCHGKKPYVLTLKSLLDPIFNEETFGGITLNYEKGQEVVLVSKENIIEALQTYLQNQ